MNLDYPRPQMVREKYMLLNDGWTLMGKPIRMPYPPQAQNSLWQESGGSKNAGSLKAGARDAGIPNAGNFNAGSKNSAFLGIGNVLVYEKTFTLPRDYIGSRILLHFGAVDQTAEVFLNGEYLGRHEDGYLPFTFEITDLVEAGEENTLRVLAVDTQSEVYPRGKQSKNPGGMWYTPVSGIWQTVWIEPVPFAYISDIKLRPDVYLRGVHVRVIMGRTEEEAMLDPASDVDPGPDFEQSEERDQGWFHGRLMVRLVPGEDGRLSRATDWVVFEKNHGFLNLYELFDRSGISDTVHLWSPEDPYLYYMEVRAGRDTILTYFGLRTVMVKEREDVFPVTGNSPAGFFLNQQRIFLHGVLDQGYFENGIFVPDSWKDYERDILRMQSLGFNTLRKHVKIEPEQFYYLCDRLGMMVIQDFVSSGGYDYTRDTVLPTLGFRKRRDRTGSPERISVTRLEDPAKEKERQKIFIHHMKGVVKKLYNHPCVVCWTCFNEGWGQFESDRLYEKLKTLDTTRPVDSTSGWFAQKKSDFDSRHVYFVSRRLRPGKRPMLLSECGGYGLEVPGHEFTRADREKKSLGYGTVTTRSDLTERILQMYEKMVLPAIPEGLCGAVYTQVSDVEEEINGLYTYDRKVCKVYRSRMKELAKRIREAVKNSP